MAGNAPKSLGESLGVTVLAPWADLCTTSYRIPSGVSPFDRR